MTCNKLSLKKRNIKVHMSKTLSTSTIINFTMYLNATCFANATQELRYTFKKFCINFAHAHASLVFL